MIVDMPFNTYKNKSQALKIVKKSSKKLNAMNQIRRRKQDQRYN